MKALKLLTIIVIAVANFACGSNKTVFTNDPSMGALTDPNATLAYCNLISAPNINGRMKAVTADTVEIYFDPSLATSLGSNALKFYKWYVRPDGTPYINPTALKIVMRDYQSGQLITGEWPEISQAMVDEYVKVYQVPAMSLQQFLANKVAIITGVEMEYDALRLSIQSGGNQMFSMDALIPAFAANPNTYAATHSPLLSALHPNTSVATQGWTDQIFQQRTMSYCF